MTSVLLGLGANQGDRKANLQLAWQFLQEASGVFPQKLSRFYETEPIGGPVQPKYLNAVALIQTTLSPTKMLQLCQEIEQRLHRNREIHWGPRTIDLDILLFGDLVIETENLIIPHPLMHLRSFVLIPALEIAPTKVLPTTGLTVEHHWNLLNRCE